MPAWGRSADIIAAQVKVEVLERENQALREQVRNLQDALVAATAPAVYQNMLAARAAKEVPPPEDPEVVHERAVLKRYAEEMDAAVNNNIFRNADEFIDFMKGGISPALESKLEEAATAAPNSAASLHGNDES